MADDLVLISALAHHGARRLARIAQATNPSSSPHRAALDAEEARWLFAAKHARVHEHLGYGSLVEYLQRLLGYEPRTARDRVRVALALEGLPGFRDALSRGAISFSALRELTRIATPQTEQALLAAAAGKTIREIEELVAGRAPGDLPTDPKDPNLQPRHLRLELSPETYAAWLEARRTLEVEVGGHLDDDELVAMLIRQALDDAPPASGSATRPRHELAVTVCQRCDHATVDAGGQILDVGPDALALARCDAAHVGHLGGPPVRRTVEIPPRTRRHVERRDHGRCAVPGCGSARYLEIHHIVQRSSGGGHHPSNLTLLCQGHRYRDSSHMIDARSGPLPTATSWLVVA